MELFTIAEVAHFLTISECTVRRLMKSGAFPYRQIGRQIRITEEDIDAFLDAAKRNQSAQKEAAIDRFLEAAARNQLAQQEAADE